MNAMTLSPSLTRLAAALVLTATCAGCAPLLVGGAVIGSGLVLTDRRTSYNRIVLITGEVPAEAEKAAVGNAVKQVENVRDVVNELVVAPNSPLGSRSNDAVLSAKVKATFVDAKDLQANAFKVVAERGVIFLMGRVTEREAARGAELASSVSGVKKVVRVLELLTEQQLGELGRAAQPAAPASSPR